MADLSLDPRDIESLASKLDEFGAVLTDKEKALLAAAFGLASTALSQAGSEAESGGVQIGAIASRADSKVQMPQSAPSLSAAFRKSFTAGKPGRFTIGRGGEVADVSVGGTTVTWTA
jgi:hypothetical protein